MGYFKNHPILRVIIDAGLVIATLYIVYSAGYVAGYQEGETVCRSIYNLYPITIPNSYGGV